MYQKIYLSLRANTLLYRLLMLFSSIFFHSCIASDVIVQHNNVQQNIPPLAGLFLDKVTLGYIRRHCSQCDAHHIQNILYPYCQMYTIEERTVRYSNGDIKAILIANSEDTVGYIGFISVSDYNTFKATYPNKNYIVQFYSTGKVLKSVHDIKKPEECYLKEAAYTFGQKDDKIKKIFMVIDSPKISNIHSYTIAFDPTQQKKLAFWHFVKEEALPAAEQVPCNAFCIPANATLTMRNLDDDLPSNSALAISLSHGTQGHSEIALFNGIAQNNAKKETISACIFCEYESISLSSSPCLSPCSSTSISPCLSPYLLPYSCVYDYDKRGEYWIDDRMSKLDLSPKEPYLFADPLLDKIVVGYTRQQCNQYIPLGIQNVLYQYCQIYTIEECNVSHITEHIKAILISNTEDGVGYIGFISITHYNDFKQNYPTKDYAVYFYNTEKILHRKGDVKNKKAHYLLEPLFSFSKKNSEIVSIFILLKNHMSEEISSYGVFFSPTQQNKLVFWDTITQKVYPPDQQFSPKVFCVPAKSKVTLTQKKTL